MSFYTQQGECLLLHCLVQPKASRDEMTGIQDTRLKIRITAPPVDGKANAQLIRYLSDTLHIPRSRIELVNGETGKRKTLKISGMIELPAVLQPFDMELSGKTPT